MQSHLLTYGTDTNRRRYRWAGAVMVGLVVAALSWPAVGAAESVPVERPARAVVVPSSFRVYGPMSDRDFEHSVRHSLRQGVTRYLANHDEVFELVSARRVRRQLKAKPLYEDTLSVAEQWAELGIESYKHLRNDEAIEQLENAIERFEEIRYGMIAPERVAEVLMYLSLAYLNQGENAARPLVLMKRMIQLDPSRVLRRGFYPDQVVNFYASAREDILRELREQGPQAPEAEELLERTSASLAVFASVFPRGDGRFEVKMYVYSEAGGAFIETDTATVPDASGETMRRTANRMISRLAPCVFQPETDDVKTIVQTRGDSPVSIKLSYTYASFMQFPGRLEVPFGNMGAGLGADLLLTEEFGLRVEFQVLNSMRDYNGFIVDHFNTVRGFFGPDLGIDVGQFNFGLSVAVEGASVGNFTLCKQVDQLATGCPADTDRESFDNLDFMLGVNARPRIRFDLVESIEMVSGFSFSYFFLPTEERALNNPIAGEVGFRYRF